MEWLDETFEGANWHGVLVLAAGSWAMKRFGQDTGVAERLEKCLLGAVPQAQGE